LLVHAYGVKFISEQITPRYNTLRKDCSDFVKGNSIYVFNKEMNVEEKTDTVIKTVGVAVIAGYFLGTVAMLASGVATFSYLTRRDNETVEMNDFSGSSSLDHVDRRVKTSSGFNLGAPVLKFLRAISNLNKA
jgi:hypothetical protein